MVTDGVHDVVSVLFDVDVNRFVKKKCGRLVGAAEVGIILVRLYLFEFLYVYDMFDTFLTFFYVFKANNAGFYPCAFEALKNKQLLFIVEKKTSTNPNQDGSYKVKWSCDDPGVIDSFLEQYFLKPKHD